MLTISESSYKDQKAIVLESNQLRVTCIPHIGAKIASVIYKPMLKELLTQRAGDKYKVQPYAGDYLQSEGSAFDDMFPNIDECFYHSFPWEGARLPDHGEVWQLPWEVNISADTIHFKVNGIRLPYILEKRISFEGEDVLVIKYRATNPTPFEMDFAWAAHLMLNANSGDTITLDENLKNAFVTYCLSKQMGDYGNIITFPYCKDVTGNSVNLANLPGPVKDDFFKFYFQESMTSGVFKLNYIAEKKSLEITVPVDTVPFLGLLYNSGGGSKVIGIDGINFYFEPCTAPFDRPDIARLHKKQSTLKPYEEINWYLKMTVK